jgi:thiosulfate/3-mercaptopyruvate sulfurtransferase
MSKALHLSLLLAISGCLPLTQSLKAAPEINGNLVTSAWLEKNLHNPDLVILDASPAAAFAANHIPGAVHVDLFGYGLMELPPAAMEKVFQSLGIAAGKKIVLYDQGGSFMATRIFFSLYYYGFPAPDLLVLDGGFFQWQKAGLPVTKEPTPAPVPTTFQIGKVNQDAKAELPEFLTASGDPAHNVLLEALGPEWHYGEVAPFNRAGHIPRSTLLPSADFYNPDRTFKSPEDITKMLTYFGVKPDQNIYTYCGGGVAASGPYFALKFILNYPHVKLYTQSELGWLSDERDLPYWTYDTPVLMRDTPWLQFWAGPQLRSLGMLNVSIVDIRPASDFNQGHLPFALNVPADAFQAHRADPAKLAEILGAAGVNASHEAVVVSGAGLTKDSALAFVLLEALGQRRASLFIDSIEKWTQPGRALTKDPSPATAATYTANPRQGLVITDPNSTHGIYPKVFLASGKDLPAKAPDGKVVHLPYSSLLNPDGSPKPAKEIWKALEQAGVPRYAELVCFADDPGEAAVNYYILKLMGYPDIKVMI